MSGKLYIVSTPIGNLRDITLRALDILGSVDFIAAEDTRVTSKLLNRYNLKKSILSYHEHNKFEKGKLIISRLKSGNDCALVSDAGTPSISDPGNDLVKLCKKEDIQVITIPGACAAISAISVSSLDTSCFCFKAFLSTKNNERSKQLDQLSKENSTIILYEAPHRLLKTLKDIKTYCGNRKITLARELTKIHEEILDLDLNSAIDFYCKKNPPKGEFVIVIQGLKNYNQENPQNTIPVDKAVELAKNMVKCGKSKNEAAKSIARQFCLKKSDIYKELF